MLNLLSPEEQYIILHKWTEAPYSGEYRDTHTDGIYICRQCDTPLYWSDNKFDSHCGWPSFDNAIPWAVSIQPDSDGQRSEIICKHCQWHLWHIFFGEQYTDNNTRHCVNSLSMRLIVKADISDTILNQIPYYEIAVLWGGCFWCIEWPLQQIPGIIEVRSGYMGGKRTFPTYERICTWVSGYIEVVQVFFDPHVITYDLLLAYFFILHDPTSRDRQGNDVGTQYRSVIFTYSDDQAQVAHDMITKLNDSDKYTQPIVTEVRPVERFYLAEPYHQNFYHHNPHKPYCQLVVKPKIDTILSMI